jgi:hypothetical protein
MDAVLYIQAAREELQDLSEESLIRKFVDNNGLDNAMQANGLDIDYPKYEDGYDDEEED